MAIPGLVRMFSGEREPVTSFQFKFNCCRCMRDLHNQSLTSGCADTQTSADVSNVATFELPPDAGPGGAGGACTNALISLLVKERKYTWVAVSVCAVPIVLI